MSRKFMAPLAILVLQFITIAAATAAHSPTNSLLSEYFTWNSTLVESRYTVINVERYGAVGDGRHDSTQAFARAWHAACKKSSAMLLVPGNKKFVVNNVVFQGPCQRAFIFKVDGAILAPQNPKSWKNSNIWMQFDKLEAFSLTGKGTIDGQGKSWWSGQCKVLNGRKSCNDRDRPTAIYFNNCKEVVVQGLSLVNSPKFHLTFGNCEGVKIAGLKIQAPQNSPNTDGIDIFASKNFVIQDSIVGTGDDCIAIGTGCSYITIKNLKCGPGHGISIGSLGRDNSRAEVSNVHVDGAKFIGTQNGLRIKTWQGGSGFARSITFENVEMINAGNPIIIDQFYCSSLRACKNQRSAVKIEDVTYKHIFGTSATAVAVNIECSKSVACSGIKLSDISLKRSSGGRNSATSCHIENARGYSSGFVNPACKNLRP